MRPRLSRLAPIPFAVALAACATSPAEPPPATSSMAAGPPPVLMAGAGRPSALPVPVPFISLEGPLWVASGPYLLFSDVVEKNGPGAVIYRFDPAMRRFSIFPYVAADTAPTSTNGLAVDAAGNLIATERWNARLVRVSPEGERTVLADAWPPSTPGHPGLPLNAPNDVVVRADGNIYFTDTDWGARPGGAHAPMAVYRVPPQGPLDRVLQIEKPNGIALSPDGWTLYIGSDVQGKIWKVPLDAAGAAGAPTLLIDGARVPGGFKVPDGICVDDTGNLYIANNSDEIMAIEVFDPAGRLLGRIPLPAAPSNCTFGGADRRTLYVTTLHAVYAVRVSTPGFP